MKKMDSRCGLTKGALPISLIEIILCNRCMLFC